MIVLPVHDERLHGPVPNEAPADVPAGSRKRRALAQQLHAQLADPPSWTGPDRLGWSVLDVPAARWRCPLLARGSGVVAPRVRAVPAGRRVG